MKKILITGGPVHAYLDDVKIITNRFKGGRMAELAEDLADCDAEITYLCSPKVGAILPAEIYIPDIKVVTHNGFDDYYAQVLKLAPQMDAVILGAAVANLIPAKAFLGKFPSHNYKPGDIIPIDFTIAPRVIDEVKKVAPNTHLFGFKLLSGVSYEELIKAAYGIVLEAKATAVFANDAADLDQKYIVTKERGVHPLKQKELASWIWKMLQDEYYSTEYTELIMPSYTSKEKINKLIAEYKDKFTLTEAGLIFGTVAVRDHYDGVFLTTGRGKKELESRSYVAAVDHTKRIVYISDMYGKASLNAPLLARMFDNLRVDHIVHYHEMVENIPTYDYAPPGTVRDTERPNTTSFNIKEHGCMLLFDKEGVQL